MAVRRILVVANEVIGADRLVEEVTKHAGPGCDAEAMIVAPTLVKSPLDLAAGDIDDDRAAAGRRMDASIEALGRSGIPATGQVGEADPVLAMRDALVGFPADEAVIVALPSESATWLEKDLLERARSELSLPVTHVEVEPGGSRAGEDTP